MYRRLWIALIAALLALHVALPLVRPLHIDSYQTGGKLMLSWSELFAHLKDNAYPPLYYVLMKLYTSVAGLSLFALYLPGMLATVACAPALAWAMRPRVSSPRVRLGAAALAGFHPFLILYGSGYAKAYAFMYLLMIVGAGLYLRGRFVWFLVCCVVASQLHSPALLLPLACLVHAAAKRRAVGPTAAAAAVSVGLYGFYLARVKQRLVNRVGMNWLEPQSLADLGHDFACDLQWFFFGTLRPSVFGGGIEQALGWVLVALVVVAVARKGLFLVAVPLLVLVAVDRFSPIYFFRYSGFLLFPAAALIAVVGGALRDRGRRRVAAALLIALMATRMHGLVSLGRTPVFRDWARSYNEGIAAARVAKADLLVLDQAGWPEVWTRYLFHLEGPPPDDVRIAWLKGWFVPDPKSLAAAVAGCERVVVTGHGAPDLALPDWKLVGVRGWWHRYDERNGRVHRHILHAFFRPAGADATK